MSIKQEIRDEFFKNHTTFYLGGIKVTTCPHDLFEWMYSRIRESIVDVSNTVSGVEELGEGKIRCNSCHKVVDKDYCSYLNCRLKQICVNEKKRFDLILTENQVEELLKSLDTTDIIDRDTWITAKVIVNDDTEEIIRDDYTIRILKKSNLTIVSYY